MFPYLFSAGSEANVKQCVLFVPGRPTVYLLFISIIRNKTCTFRISVCITYSGHNPFLLPDSLKKVFFSPEVPEVLNNYMTMANYTDRALGEFIAQLRADKRFENTLIMIMGDHEALGTVRKELCDDPVGKQIVSDKSFVPLIILNAPFNLYYGKVMGQVDVYPTLLDLLGLNDYWWHGMGESILDPHRPGFEVDPQLNVLGDTAGVSKEDIYMAKKAWEISDMIIRYDYLGHRHDQNKRTDIVAVK